MARVEKRSEHSGDRRYAIQTPSIQNGHLARFRVPEVRIERFAVVCWPFVPLGGRRSAFLGGWICYFEDIIMSIVFTETCFSGSSGKGTSLFLIARAPKGWLRDKRPWSREWPWWSMIGASSGSAGSPIVRPCADLFSNVSYYFHVSYCETEVMTLDITGIRAE